MIAKTLETRVAVLESSVDRNTDRIVELEDHRENHEKQIGLHNGDLKLHNDALKNLQTSLQGLSDQLEEFKEMIRSSTWRVITILLCIIAGGSAAGMSIWDIIQKIFHIQ